jgi:hypothetical protein
VELAVLVLGPRHDLELFNAPNCGSWRLYRKC